MDHAVSSEEVVGEESDLHSIETQHGHSDHGDVVEDAIVVLSSDKDKFCDIKYGAKSAVLAMASQKGDWVWKDLRVQLAGVYNPCDDEELKRFAKCLQDLKGRIDFSMLTKNAVWCYFK